MSMSRRTFNRIAMLFALTDMVPSLGASQPGTSNPQDMDPLPILDEWANKNGIVPPPEVKGNAKSYLDYLGTLNPAFNTSAVQGNDADPVTVMPSESNPQGQPPAPVTPALPPVPEVPRPPEVSIPAPLPSSETGAKVREGAEILRSLKAEADALRPILQGQAMSFTAKGWVLTGIVESMEPVTAGAFLAFLVGG